MLNEEKTHADVAKELLCIVVDLRNVRNRMLDVTRWAGASLADGTSAAGHLIDKAMSLTQKDLGAFTFYDHVEK